MKNEKGEEVETQEKDNLQEFGGWEQSDMTFFGQEKEETPVDILAEAAKDDLPAEKEKEKIEKTPEEIEAEKEKEKIAQEEFSFGTETEEGKEKLSPEEVKEKEEKEKVLPQSVTTLNYLKEAGVVDFELEEGEELTEEVATDLIETKFNESVEDAITELFDDLPQVVKDLNKFALKGGKVEEFLGTLTKQSSVKIKKGLDLKDEKNQELVSREMLSEEGYDEEYIETQIGFLKDSKKLEMFAEKKYDIWSKKDEKAQADLVTKQTEYAEKVEQNKKKLKTSLSTFVKDNDSISGFKLDRKDRKELPSYMTDQSVKLETGGAITPFQKDLYTALKEENKAVLLAKLLRTDFDFSTFEKSVSTKVIKEVKKNVRRSGNVPKSSSGSSQDKKSLSSYFGEK